MISNIRKQFKTQAAVYRSVLWIIIAAFTIGMFVMPTALRYSKAGGMWVIRVNNEEVGYRDFVRETQGQQQRLLAFKEQYGDYAELLLQSMGLSSDPKLLAAQTIIRQEILNQTADKIGIYLHPDYIAHQMANPRFLVQELAGFIPPQAINIRTGELNQEVIRRVLKQQGLSIEQFERLVERLLQARTVMEITGTAFYMPEFAQEYYLSSYRAQKTFSVVTLAEKMFIEREKKNAVADEQLKTFYEEQNRQKRYHVPEKRSGQLWKFDPKQYGISISDDQISSYYEDNKVKRYIDKPATVTIRHILLKPSETRTGNQLLDIVDMIKQKATENPESFASLAQQYSEDKETKDRGGLMEPFARGEKSKELEKAAFLLQKDGEVAAVQVPNGIEVIQRVSKQKPTYKPLSSVKNEIKNVLQDKEFGRQFVADMKAVLEKPTADEKRSALEELVKQKNAKAAKIEDITDDGSEERARILFKLSEGGVNFFVEEDTGNAILLTKINKSYTPAFSQIKDTVRENWYEAQAEKAMQKASDQVKEGVLKVDDLIKDGLALRKTVGPVSMGDTESIQTLQAKGIPIQRMLDLEHIGSQIVHPSSDGIMLISLTQSTPPEKGNSEEETKAIQELKSKHMRLFTDGFVASLTRNATIETNDQILTI